MISPSDVALGPTKVSTKLELRATSFRPGSTASGLRLAESGRNPRGVGVGFDRSSARSGQVVVDSGQVQVRCCTRAPLAKGNPQIPTS